MSVYNVNHIENLYDDFISCKKNFSNDYSDIKSSYIYTSTTSSMKSLEKKLDALYSKIQTGYKNIDTYWASFINDVKKTEGYLKGSNGTGSIKESAIVSAINKLPKLDTYDAKFSDWFNTLGAMWEKADESFTAKVEEGRETVAKLEQGWEDWLVLLEEDPKRALKEGGATVVVTATTIISGIYDLAETLVDGYVYIRAECSSAILDVLGFEEKAMEVKTEAANFIQTSYVDKVNDALYSTDLFKKINDESYLKYDSETAMKIRSASKGVTEFVLATALNCIPGVGQLASAALLLGVGFTSGVGEKAQEVYQTHGTDYDGDTEILLSGVVNAVDFYGKGQIGKLGVTAVKSVVSKGATSVVSNVTTQAAKNPSFMKQLLKNVFDVDNVIDSAAAAANNITYSKEEGWQIDGEKFLQEFGINILITTGTSAVPVLMDAKHASTAKNVDVNVSSVDDAVDSYKSASKSLTNDEILNLNRTLSSSEKTQIWREYNDTLNKWGDDFDSYKNKVINHGAGDLNKLDEMARDLKRLEQIEGKLEIPSSKSVVNATENWTSYNKAQADELAEEISQRPIPAMEKYKVDTNSEEYKRAIREIYSNPSPTGTQFLNNANNPFNQTNAKLTLDDLKYSKSKTSQYTAEYLKSNIRKYSYTNTNFVEGLNDSIKANGLYHFTDYSDEILSSGYIKKTGAINSYGTPKTFFFNGIPSAGQMATNLDSLPLTATAVKVVPSDEILSSSKLKVRNLDDGAISFDGNFDLANSKATKEYFCIFKENDELVYKKVSREFYESYPNTAEGKMMQDFLSNKKNIESIRTDYLSEVSEKFAESRRSMKNVSDASEKLLRPSVAVTNANVDSINFAKKASKNDISFNAKKSDSLLDKFKKGTDAYGGNQGSSLELYKKKFKTSIEKTEAKLIEDTIRKYYPDMSKREIEKFLAKMKSDGCTYVATANNIYEQLNYDPVVFKQKLGFEMYLPNGQLNHNQLITDIYAHMSTKVHVDVNGSFEFKTYDSWTAAAKDLYGVDLPYQEANIKVLLGTKDLNCGYHAVTGNPDGTVSLKKVISSQKSTVVGTPQEIAYKLTGKNVDISAKELPSFLEKNGINTTGKVSELFAGEKVFARGDNVYLEEYLNSKKLSLVERNTSVSRTSNEIINDVKKAFEEGYSINVNSVSGKPVSMTDGTKLGWVTTGDDGCGHAMIVRGVNENGDIIVSSWGKKYLIPNDFVPEMRFNFIKIGVDK